MGIAPGRASYFQKQAEQIIRDFYVITKNGRKLNGTDMADLNNKSVSWLKASLVQRFDGPTIVISHFAPVLGCIDDKWVKPLPALNEYSPYFINELTSLIKRFQPDIWFYGHTHSNINLQIGNTKILTNQQGYAKDDKGYDREHLIEVKM